MGHKQALYVAFNMAAPQIKAALKQSKVQHSGHQQDAEHCVKGSAHAGQDDMRQATHGAAEKHSAVQAQHASMRQQHCRHHMHI